MSIGRPPPQAVAREPVARRPRSAASPDPRRLDAGGRAAAVRALQRSAGNAATVRHLARKTLKEKVDEARAQDPRGYVLQAVTGMAAGGKWTFEERAAEIVWRMIWMFAPERTNTTMVRADPNARGLEVDPKPIKGFVELVVGPDFIDGITAANLDNRITILKLVFTGKDAVIAKLKGDFGFAAVEETSSKWTLGELAETYAGLERMPTEDRGALSGVTLRRVATIMHHGKSMDGEFEWDVGGGGETTAPTLTQTFKMADSAFSDPDRAAWIAVHESGHAVDSDVRRRAMLATGVATAESNKAINTLNADAAAALGALRTALERANHYGKAEAAAARPFIAAVRAAHTAVNNLAFNSEGNVAARETAAANAVAARDAARAKLPAGNPAGGDFKAAIELQDTFLASARAFVSARKTRIAAEGAEAKASGATDKTISRRLERFVAIVRRHRIAPVTPYARDNWPDHPEEFYAEAYSMWRNDPGKLEQLARPLKAFFDAGEHR